MKKKIFSFYIVVLYFNPHHEPTHAPTHAWPGLPINPNPILTPEEYSMALHYNAAFIYSILRKTGKKCQKQDFDW